MAELRQGNPVKQHQRMDQQSTLNRVRQTALRKKLTA